MKTTTPEAAATENAHLTAREARAAFQLQIHGAMTLTAATEYAVWRDYRSLVSKGLATEDKQDGVSTFALVK